MVSLDVRWIIKAPARALMLAVIFSPCTTLSTSMASPPDFDSLRAVADAIDEIQSAHGINAPHLIDPLTAVALFYQERGDHDLATAALQRARQVTRVNYGLYSLEEAPLLRRLIQVEEARGDAEAAWELEQRLIRLIGRHPNDLRTVPFLLAIADRRVDVLQRYEAGEFPPEIVLGCYYSESRYDSQTGTRGLTGCRSGGRRTVIRALTLEVGRYQGQARSIQLRHERWLAFPCDRPQVPDIPESQHLSRREVRSIEDETARYLRGMSNYVACMEVKHEHAADTDASPSDVAQLASDRDEAIEELQALRALYEQRIGSIRDLDHGPRLTPRWP
jgi:tetratricopeptide (TPR) repeat protein